MSRLARLGAAGACLALAPLLLFQAMASSNDPAGPLLAMDGFNLAALSRTGMGVTHKDGVTTLAVDDNALAMARRAFVREPLATDALFVLAVDERAREGADGDQQLLAAAAGIDRRNRLLNSMQMEQDVRRGDFVAMSRSLDRMARIEPDMGEQFVLPVVQALADERVLAPVRRILERSPVWAPAFWMAVPNNPLLAGRMYQLRQTTDQGTTPESDARLMDALVAGERYADAFAFRDRVSGRRAAGSGFVAAGGTAPFNWDAQSSGELSMSPQGGNGYELFVQRGFSGELGRQLLRLAPGAYRFSAKMTPVSQAANFSLRMRCADNPEQQIGPRPMPGPVSFTVPAGCRHWWLVIEGSAWQARGEIRAEIEDMQFVAQP